MRIHAIALSDQDLATFRAVSAFLKGRLQEQATVDWSLRLKAGEDIKRYALLDLLATAEARQLKEPRLTAWRLIEESWSDQGTKDRVSEGAFAVKRRIAAGDRSGSLVAAIVDLVRPRLEVRPFSGLDLHFRKLPKRPRSFEDLFSTSLTSGETLDSSKIGISDLSDRAFLVSLANSLDAAVTNGLDIARRTGWDDEGRFWRLGGLHRVYYVPVQSRPPGEEEPDEFHKGIAPSVKLLHGVVAQLAKLDIAVAKTFVARWVLAKSSVHLRLWAALCRDPRIASGDEVSDVLLALGSRQFWNVNDFPEIAEVRVIRFSSFSAEARAAITRKILRLPPTNLWSTKLEAEKVKSARTSWAVRELKRIEIADGVLPENGRVFLASNIDDFPMLVDMARVDEDFIGSPEAREILPNPDRQFDSLVGIDRLTSLESALASTQRTWDDDPAQRASDWIGEKGNAQLILHDLETTGDGGAAFHRVWDRFGWAHLPRGGDEASEEDLAGQANRVLTLFAKLPADTIRASIDGISNWLSSWRKFVVESARGPETWLRVWPIAIDATNSAKQADEAEYITAIPQEDVEDEPADIDTLNTPTGKLIDVFLVACPNLSQEQSPFRAGSVARQMRDALEKATGNSRIIAQHRLIEALPYFLRADSDWARAYLIDPLIENNTDALILWRAIARQTRFTEVLRTIGPAMAERALDLRLARETRRSLVFSLVVECLHAFRDRRDPAVSYTRIQQVIRRLDDEVRAHAADTIGRFIRDLSAKTDQTPNPPRREHLFRDSAEPFLKNVWPQERSLATPGVSAALADLPASCGDAFVEAVDAIQRFLVPFECWSMIDYGFYDDDANPTLSTIDDASKAEALLRLLDLTIGKSEGAVVPYDLSDALDRVGDIAPALKGSPVFRRLATAARRS